MASEKFHDHGQYEILSMNSINKLLTASQAAGSWKVSCVDRQVCWPTQNIYHPAKIFEGLKLKSSQLGAVIKGLI